MPRFDGTGPDGLGPMTGRCEGYCIIPIENREDLQTHPARGGKSTNSRMTPLKDPFKIPKRIILHPQSCFWNPIRHQRKGRITYDYCSNLRWKRLRFTH
jgi:hypothetical protein